MICSSLYQDTLEPYLAVCEPSASEQEDELILAAIHQLQAFLEQIRLEELDRYRKKLPSSEIQLAETLSVQMMKKILNIPLKQLKASGSENKEHQIKVLGEIFSLPA